MIKLESGVKVELHVQSMKNAKFVKGETFSSSSSPSDSNTPICSPADGSTSYEFTEEDQRYATAC